MSGGRTCQACGAPFARGSTSAVCLSCRARDRTPELRRMKREAGTLEARLLLWKDEVLSDEPVWKLPMHVGGPLSRALEALDVRPDDGAAFLKAVLKLEAAADWIRDRDGTDRVRRPPPVEGFEGEYAVLKTMEE